jgi:hypothetical protein
VRRRPGDAHVAARYRGVRRAQRHHRTCSVRRTRLRVCDLRFVRTLPLLPSVPGCARRGLSPTRPIHKLATLQGMLNWAAKAAVDRREPDQEPPAAPMPRAPRPPTARHEQSARSTPFLCRRPRGRSHVPGSSSPRNRALGRAEDVPRRRASPWCCVSRRPPSGERSWSAAAASGN